ncbi:uncharacterized protein LOC131018726 [Salvia miltiorrhiza]|uniref:uncharacterized protein LOC131018726 n=1 Tax=Salvia miltiorrhiza TaxID=226208 RepID=UPI0025ACD995|nr:uncharacterized protein LOC131018726 [Salvia miltiorrhiza]
MAEENSHPKSAQLVTFYDILSSHGLPIGIFPKSISGFSVDPMRHRVRDPPPDLFLSLPAKGIQVDIPSSGLIYFDVEVVFKQFSLSLFDTLKNCSSAEDVDGYGDLLKIPQV